MQKMFELLPLSPRKFQLMGLSYYKGLKITKFDHSNTRIYYKDILHLKQEMEFKKNKLSADMQTQVVKPKSLQSLPSNSTK